jgi:hypothetical protein
MTCDSSSGIAWLKCSADSWMNRLSIGPVSKLMLTVLLNSSFENSVVLLVTKAC